MTLAAILLSALFALSPLQSATATPQAAPPSTQATSPGATATQGQSNAPPQTSAPKPAAVAPHTKPRPHKKKPQPVNCDPAPAGGTSTPGMPASSADSAQTPTTSADPSSGTKATVANTPSAPVNCPPPLKITVVKQGGTSEPSIQLAGDATSSPLRDTNQCPNASQCLQLADQNLKKIAGRQLTSNQRDMVTQIHQFMDQSTRATAAGDLESARILALKAQQLSQELLNPEK